MHEQNPTNEQDRWRQLAIELGIEPDSAPPGDESKRETEAARSRTEIVEESRPSRGQKESEVEVAFASNVGEREEPGGASESAAVAEEIQGPEYESEAPSSEAEHAAEDESPRGRRRRGRRSSRGGRGRRGRDRGGDREAPAEAAADEELLHFEEPAPAEEEAPRREHGRRPIEEEAAVAEEVEEEEVAEESEEESVEAADSDDEELEELDDLSDWNVPSWNELIASLYRPER